MLAVYNWHMILVKKGSVFMMPEPLVQGLWSHSNSLNTMVCKLQSQLGMLVKNVEFLILHLKILVWDAQWFAFFNKHLRSLWWLWPVGHVMMASKRTLNLSLYRHSPGNLDSPPLSSFFIHQFIRWTNVYWRSALSQKLLQVSKRTQQRKTWSPCPIE